MIKTKEEGANTKEKRIFPFPCYLKMTPIVLLFPLFCVCVFGGELGRGVELFLSDLGNKCSGGNSEGALFWLCLPTFDQEHTGP